MPAAAGSDCSRAEPDPIVQGLMVDGGNAGGSGGAQHADEKAGDEGAVIKPALVDAVVVYAYMAVANAHHPADGDKNVHDELQHRFLVEAVLMDADLDDASLHGVREFGGDREIGFRDDHSVGDCLLAGAEVGLGPRKPAFVNWLRN